MGTISRPGGMRPKWHKKRIKRLKLRRRRMRQRSKETVGTMHPRVSGPGVFPRYGGGWMHQFGHVYALQQELLRPGAGDWFRALELCHTARAEGVALNAAHYTNALRQCVPAAAWEAALAVLRHMRREGARPDVVGVGCALAACADAGKGREAEAVFQQFEGKMKLDSMCYLALIKAKMGEGKWDEALHMGKKQRADGVPFLPYTYTHLLEAANEVDDEMFALELVEQVSRDGWSLSERSKSAFKQLCLRHDLEAEYVRLIGDREGDAPHQFLPRNEQY